MSVFERMERKIRKPLLPNMMIVLICCYVTGYVINRLFPSAVSALCFEPVKILRGQIWRIFTFVFVTSSSDIFLVLITCFIYISISRALEQIIGRFRLNFFLISGILIEAMFGFLFFLVFGNSENVFFVLYLSPYYLYAMLFVLFAMMYPDARFLLMFIIPVRGKWMIFITFAMYALDVIQAFTNGIPGYGWLMVFMIIAAVLTVVLFILLSGRSFRNRNVVRMRSAARTEHVKEKKTARHKCAVCGRTELTNPELEFRYCSRCAGNHEYCNEHLYTHFHVGTERTDGEDQ